MEGTGWVFGSLIGILAVALIIAGVTGHGTQLFQGITGKSATSSTASSSSASSAIDAALTGLASTGAQSATAGTSSGGGTTNPYAGLSTIQNAGLGVAA